MGICKEYVKKMCRSAKKITPASGGVRKTVKQERRDRDELLPVKWTVK